MSELDWFDRRPETVGDQREVITALPSQKPSPLDELREAYGYATEGYDEQEYVNLLRSCRSAAMKGETYVTVARIAKGLQAELRRQGFTLTWSEDRPGTGTGCWLVSGWAQ